MENTSRLVIMTLEELMQFIDERDKKNASKMASIEKPKNEDWLTTDEACKLIHGCKGTLRNYYTKGILKKRLRLGRRVFYSKKEILSYENNKNR